MKKFLKIAAGVAAVIALFVGAIFYFTAGMSDAADSFFAAASEGDTASAHSYLSSDFKAGTDESELAGYLAANSLDKVRDMSWSTRKIEGGKGILSGTVTTQSGTVVPVDISFVKEDGDWKIYGIDRSSSGLQRGDPAARLPDNEAQAKLVHDTMGYFAQSVENRSMEILYANVSDTWQRQTDVAELDRIFNEFYGNISLIGLRELKPVITRPATMEDDGSMSIKGHYNGPEHRVEYDFSYVLEGAQWEILGVTINVR
ncbi:hypothetical protein [Sphingorhabdus sp. Alg239-R122]|uniref:hypothetical protein n=1 Tax=Sphingorhabdus sp. Alg239-R122 TaxID=2305989 RepID=UPI0013DA4226|nr:hypothetical protein [Sphingorhabdus sp. Alg239-R122]